MHRHHATRSGIAWLELLLGIAAVALLLQLFPSAFDARNWSRSTWFLVNVGVVLFLVSVRFVPGLAEDWRERRERNAKDRTKAEKAKTLKEQREAIERMQESRKRRMY